MGLTGKELFDLVGKEVESNHTHLGEVSGTLEILDLNTFMAAIADPRFKDSAVLKDGLVWVDISLVRPKSLEL